MTYEGKIVISSNEHIALNAVCPQMEVTSHKQCFETLAGLIADRTGQDKAVIMGRLWMAEQESPSAIGNGVALPHAQFPELDAPFTLFARLSANTDFRAFDRKPVHMVFALLSPIEDARPYHLRRLAHISRLLSDHTFRQNLKSAADEAALRYLWTTPEYPALAA